MRMVLIGLVLAAAVAAAGYFGLAEQLASGFKVLTLFFGAAILLGMAAGGVRVSARRPASPRLISRIRRTA